MMAYITAAVIAFSGWAMVCNIWTFRERERRFDEASNDAERWYNAGDYNRYKESYDSYFDVSYEKHLWYRITFRNPMRLYS